MNIAILIQTIILISYITYIKIKLGTIESISDSWYLLPKNRKILFTLFCWGIGFPMIAHIDSDSIAGLFILSAAGFTFVGTATAFKEEASPTPKVHFAGAFIGIVSAFLALGMDYNLWILSYLEIGIGAIIILLTKLKLTKYNNTIYWIEIISAILILIGLWIK